MSYYGPSPEDVARLRELAKALADLNPSIHVDEEDAILTVPFDSSSTVDANAHDGNFNLGTSFEFEDGGGTNDIFESIPTSEIAKTAEWIRATLLEMPQLKIEAAEDYAELA